METIWLHIFGPNNIKQLGCFYDFEQIYILGLSEGINLILPSLRPGISSVSPDFEKWEEKGKTMFLPQNCKISKKLNYKHASKYIQFSKKVYKGVRSVAKLPFCLLVSFKSLLLKLVHYFQSAF